MVVGEVDIKPVVSEGGPLLPEVGPYLDQIDALLEDYPMVDQTIVSEPLCLHLAV